MLGADKVMPQPNGLFPGQNDDLPRALGKSFKHASLLVSPTAILAGRLKNR